MQTPEQNPGRTPAGDKKNSMPAKDAGQDARTAPQSRPAGPQKERLAAFRREFCGGFGVWYPPAAGVLAIADLLLGFAPPSRMGDLAFLGILLFLLATLPFMLPKVTGFAASLQAARKKGQLDALLDDWAEAAPRLAHGAALGQKYVFAKNAGRFFTYDEITQILAGPAPGERHSFSSVWTLLVLRLNGKTIVKLGQCEKAPKMAYEEARDRLELALRKRTGIEKQE